MKKSRVEGFADGGVRGGGGLAWASERVSEQEREGAERRAEVGHSYTRVSVSTDACVHRRRVRLFARV